MTNSLSEFVLTNPKEITAKIIKIMNIYLVNIWLFFLYIYFIFGYVCCPVTFSLSLDELIVVSNVFKYHLKPLFVCRRL